MPRSCDRLAAAGSDDATAGLRGRRSGPARDLGRSVRRNGMGRQDGKGDPFLRRVGRQIGNPSPRDAAPIGEEADGVPVCVRSLDQPPYPPDGLRVESQPLRAGSGVDLKVRWRELQILQNTIRNLWGESCDGTVRPKRPEPQQTLSIQARGAEIGSYSGCSTRSRCIGFRDCASPKPCGTCL